MKSFLLLLSSLVLAACNNPAEPGIAVQFDIEREWVNDYSTSNLETLLMSHPVEAKAASNAIRVTGSFVTGCSGSRPVARVAQQSGSIVLLIKYPPNGFEGCALIPAPFTYKARLTGVTPGDHKIVVRHQGDFIRTDGVVLEQQVTVP